MRRSDREIEDRAEILEIIEKADVCRLAFSDGNVPYIVVMNFGFDVTEPVTFYFHCAHEWKKLDIMAKNNRVCFQADIDHELVKTGHACGWGMNYRSVVGMGTAELVRDETEKIKGFNLIMKHYSGIDSFTYDPKEFKATTIFKVVVNEITGKKREGT
jgi:nitroimidazol reductase NimA-like FMN-containing flavoprotein (pyridoxamine 5'-phosphate oxidase superfamily)